MRSLLALPILAVLSLSLPAPAAAQKALSVTWDLAKEFPDAASWDQAFAGVQARSAAFAQKRGTPLAGAAQLADLLDESRFLRGRAGYMARFALLSSNADTTDDVAKARLSAATGLEASVEGDVSWLDQAIGTLPAGELAAWRTAEPRLAKHGWVLATVLSQAGHGYRAGSEAANAQLERASFSASAVYNALMSADLAWPSIAAKDGRPVVLDPGSFGDLATSRDTDLRRRAIAAYYGRIKTLEDPLGMLLTRKYEVDHALARARNYDNGIDAVFAIGDGMPAGNVQRMIEATMAHRDVLARYVRTVARLNGIAAPRYGDLSVGAPDFPHAVTLPQAIDLAVDAAASFGKPYQALLRRRFASPWFDFGVRPHKGSGAFGIYWQIGDSHPYGVVDFHDTMGDARTVAAMGALLMFYADMPVSKLPQRREQDFPVYGNAVWLMGGLLQADRVLSRSQDRSERIAVAASDLRRLWSIFVSGVTATDFEGRVEAAVGAGKPPTGAQITRLYRDVLGDYYRDAGVTLDDSDGEEWMTFDHSYYGHIVGEWSFALAAAVTMTERVERGDSATIAAIAAPMANPASYLSYDLLRDANADPSRSEIYAAVFRRMNADMDRIDAALAAPQP